MIVTQRGVVDITPEYNRALRPVFCVSEGDKTSRQIILTVMQSGEAFLIPSGATVYIVGKKPDNNIFTYRCTYSGSEVTFNITDQMSAASGIVLCELQINLGTEVLGSANFVYWTEPTPTENGSYSESDLNIFLEAIAGAERLDNFYANIEEMVAGAVEQIQIMPGQVVIDPTLLVNGAAADAAATGNAVRSFLNALITETTAEATIATCDDAAGGLPLKKLTAQIEPTQSGTGDPSPDNICPISGYTSVTVQRYGKNLFRPAASGGSSVNVSYVRNDDYSLTFTGQANGTTRTPSLGTCTLKAGTYILSGVSGGSADTYALRIASAAGITSGCTVYDGEGTFVVETDGMVTIQGRFSNVQTAAYNVTMYPMIRPVSITDGTYEPYNGATYPVTFPTAAGTVYGGQLTVNSDGSGKLTVTTEKLTINGDTGWGGVSTDSVSGITRAYSGASYGGIDIIACDSLMVYNAYTEVNRIGKQSANTRYFITPSYIQGLTSVAEVKAALAEHPIEAVFTLATPTTYALSAVEVVQMLQGVNNVWTDAAGTLTAEYYANTALYVEKIVNAQKGMIAGVEEAMTATQNYSVGDLMIVGDALYKATAAISSGAALVVGTNVTETTVAEQLLALA